MKHKAARARSRLDELTFGIFNVRTAAVNVVNGIGHIDTLLRLLQRVVTLLDCRGPRDSPNRGWRYRQMDAAAESGRNPVSIIKHHIQPECR